MKICSERTWWEARSCRLLNEWMGTGRANEQDLEFYALVFFAHYNNYLSWSTTELVMAIRKVKGIIRWLARAARAAELVFRWRGLRERVRFSWRRCSSCFGSWSKAVIFCCRSCCLRWYSVNGGIHLLSSTFTCVNCAVFPWGFCFPFRGCSTGSLSCSWGSCLASRACDCFGLTRSSKPVSFLKPFLGKIVVGGIPSFGLIFALVGLGQLHRTHAEFHRI